MGSEATHSSGWAALRPRVVPGALLGGTACLVVLVLVVIVGPAALARTDIGIETAARIVVAAAALAPLAGGAVGAWRTGRAEGDHRERLVAGVAGPVVVVVVLTVGAVAMQGGLVAGAGGIIAAAAASWVGAVLVSRQTADR